MSGSHSETPASSTSFGSRGNCSLFSQSGKRASSRDGSSPTTSISDHTEVDLRESIRDELGPIPEVPLDLMLKHFIPDSRVDVDATMAKLKEKGVWSEETGWKVPQEKNPTGMDDKDAEMWTSSMMKYLHGSIISCSQFHGGSIPEPTLAFECLPQPSSDSEDTEDTVNYNPHYFGALRVTQDLHTLHLGATVLPENNRNSRSSRAPGLQQSNIVYPSWFDVACVGGYKADDRTEDLNENVLDIVWGMHQIMGIDHRRRFVFGITIEKENTRVWFACRQVIFITCPFNLSTNPAHFVQIIGSLAYATPTQLGFDPTMRLCWRDNAFHYDIQTTTKRPDGSNQTVLYRTQKVLSDCSSDIRGRITRVYLAMAVDQDSSVPDRFVVLKDAWIDAGRPKEGDTLDKLLDGAPEAEKKVFLTIHQHSVVQIDNQDDSTHELILHGQLIEHWSRTYEKYREYFLGLAEDPSLYDPAMEKLSDPEYEIESFMLYTPKRLEGDIYPRPRHTYEKQPNVYSPMMHYRIAFTDVGESLKKVANSGKVTIRILDRVMADITKALQYMAKKGYVHHDVSAGNIIWCGDCAKLSDLEFAEPYRGSSSEDEEPTGTYKFMAGEVMRCQYSINDSEHLRPRYKAPFKYNPIHDLESLWWIGVWCTMCHYPAPFDKALQHGSGERPFQIEYRDFNRAEHEHLDFVRRQTETLFPWRYTWHTGGTRMKEINDPGRYGRRVLRSGYPPFFNEFTTFLQNMKQCISLAYQEIQCGHPRTESSYFTDFLRIGDPSSPSSDVDKPENGLLSVHDRILQMLTHPRNIAEFEKDVLLCPLDSINRYSRLMAKKKAKKTSSSENLSA